MARPFKSAASKAAAEAKKAVTKPKRIRTKAPNAVTKPAVQTVSPQPLKVLTKEAKAKLVSIVRDIRALEEGRNQLLAKQDALVSNNIKFLTDEGLIQNPKDIPDALSTVQNVDLDAIPVWDKEVDHVAAKPTSKAPVRKRIRLKKRVTASNTPAIEIPTTAPVAVDPTPTPEVKKRGRKAGPKENVTAVKDAA
jgi:hypothetical protein